LNGHSAAIAGTKDAVPRIVSGSMSVTFNPPIGAAHDWALVKLSAPVCTAGGLPLANVTAASLAERPRDQPVYQAGYHSDFGDGQLVISTPCKVSASFPNVDAATIAREFSAPGELILHSCDTGAGSSGSPLMIDGADGAEVVGINSGTYVRQRASVPSKILPMRYRTDVVANTGASVSAFRDRLIEVSNAHLITARTDLRALQILLASKGWYSGPRDGVWSAEVRAAIEMFERLTEQPVRGMATVDVLSALRTRAAPVETGSIRHHLR
jgi:Trypsin-like peptidase domain/Putative peptidoglycan binding domain